MRDSSGVKRRPARNDDSGPKVQFLGTPTRTRAKAENNVGINKNAGLKGRRFVSTTELTLNETCQNPDGNKRTFSPVRGDERYFFLRRCEDAEEASILLRDRG